MKTNRLVWALGWVTMGSLAALQGCGGDDDDGGTGGTSSGGSAGKGGSSGSAGKGGASGSAGKGGASGSAGKGGTSGSTTGGTSGAGGEPGGAGGEGGAGVDPLRYPACQGYCQVYQDAGCFDAAADTYDNEPNCRDTCMEADWPIGTVGAMSGDSIACRTTHSGLALASATMPNETHCGHASENPPSACVD
jgi:hypothetical protein